VNPAFLAMDRTRLEPFLLCVSTLHPHKNLERLIRAYARKPRGQRLILAGVRGFHTQPVENLIRGLNLEERVEVTGWLPRDKLLGLYQHAWACVYPSTFEGFGMPAVEALAAGIPLACSDIAPLREIAGDSALLFDPLNEDSISAALDRIIGDEELRCRLTRNGRERARSFTWKRAAEATLQALLG
jgi:glycosyltransferase involved in cell wall biosynthesis